MTLEEALIAVWHAVLVEHAREVIPNGQTFPVRTTPKKRLREVDFAFDGQELRGLEQNPATGSHWAQLARAGRKVMKFLSAGRYTANVVDGKVTLYGRNRGKQKVALG
jgi:hypothetical protein